MKISWLAMVWRAAREKVPIKALLDYFGRDLADDARDDPDDLIGHKPRRQFDDEWRENDLPPREAKDGEQSKEPHKFRFLNAVRVGKEHCLEQLYRRIEAAKVVVREKMQLILHCTTKAPFLFSITVTVAGVIALLGIEFLQNVPIFSNFTGHDIIKRPWRYPIATFSVAAMSIGSVAALVLSCMAMLHEKTLRLGTFFLILTSAALGCLRIPPKLSHISVSVVAWVLIGGFGSASLAIICAMFKRRIEEIWPEFIEQRARANAARREWREAKRELAVLLKEAKKTERILAATCKALDKMNMAYNRERINFLRSIRKIAANLYFARVLHLLFEEKEHNDLRSRTTFRDSISILTGRGPYLSILLAVCLAVSGTSQAEEEKPQAFVGLVDLSTSGSDVKPMVKAQVDQFFQADFLEGSRFDLFIVEDGNQPATKFWSVEIPEEWGIPVRESKAEFQTKQLQSLDQALSAFKPELCGSSIAAGIWEVGKYLKQLPDSFDKHFIVMSDLREHSGIIVFTGGAKKIPAPEIFLKLLKRHGLLISLAGVELKVCGVHHRATGNSPWNAEAANKLESVWKAAFAAMDQPNVIFYEECPVLQTE